MPPTVKFNLKGHSRGFNSSAWIWSSAFVVSLFILIGYIFIESWERRISLTEESVLIQTPPSSAIIPADISVDQPLLLDEIPQDSIDTEIGVIAQNEHIVSTGDTLFAVLSQYGVNATAGLQLVKQYPQINRLKVGQRLAWEVDPQGNLLSLEWQISKRLVHQYRLEDGKYQERMQVREGSWSDVTLAGVITSNFVHTAREVGLNNNEIDSIIKALQWKVSFTHLPKGTQFSVIFSRETLDNVLADSTLLAVMLVASGTKHYAFLAEDGNYYDEKGQSIASGFLRYPLNKPVRISSPFNPRRLHPITGKIVAHNGVDFAMPIGTPILAAGDGEVVLAKHYSGAAGHYVAIRHGRQYLTRYMHLSKILVKPGQKIKRGDTIALSGNTGRSTGPHLHYEFHINGKPVNPMTVKLPQAEPLRGQSLIAYQASIDKLKKTLMNN